MNNSVIFVSVSTHNFFFQCITTYDMLVPSQFVFNKQLWADNRYYSLIYESSWW